MSLRERHSASCTTRLYVTLIPALTLVLACGGDQIAAPHSDPDRQLDPASGTADALRAAAVPNIDGTWNWSEEINFVFHRDLALASGITPEGEITRATCFNSGSITFDQSGSTFEGTATQPNGICRTSGGQDITNIFPDPFAVVDGLITGESLHFGFSSPDCPYQGVLTLEGDRAVAMTGQGNCNSPRLVFHSRWQASR
jgi:hypothetical protein